MDMNKETVEQLALRWADEMESLSLPTWDALPRLELYMDQVIILLTEYLGPLSRGSGEKGITPSSINNYVRLKIIPPPVKKKYSRSHVACLLMLFCLKRSMNMAAIQRLLPQSEDEESVRPVYEAFRLQFSAICAGMAAKLHAEVNSAQGWAGGGVTAAAILSNLTTDLTEYLLEDA